MTSNFWRKSQRLAEPIKPEQDAKLRTLIKRFGEEPVKSGKLLIFTQYADTARIFRHTSRKTT